MKSFALFGAAGYIAPRHLRAIRDTGNDLLFVVDPSDSVGVLDQYFPDAEYYPTSDPKSSIVNRQSSIDFVSICSPNYLHEKHIRWALEQGADVICEKPLVTDLKHLDEIEKLERASGRTVNTIMQLRLHPVVEEIRKKTERLRDSETLRLRDFETKRPGDFSNEVQPATGNRQPVTSNQQPVTSNGQKVTIQLEYISARGHWYRNSWKGREELSGGIAMNIGIHLFDLMTFLFGPMNSSRVITFQPDKARGILSLENADVEWFLSIDGNDLPAEVKAVGHRAFRNITINGESVEFTEGFTELHTLSYREILAGRGFGVGDVRESLRIVETIRRKT